LICLKTSPKKSGIQGSIHNQDWSRFGPNVVITIVKLWYSDLGPITFKSSTVANNILPLVYFLLFPKPSFQVFLSSGQNKSITLFYNFSPLLKQHRQILSRHASSSRINLGRLKASPPKHTNYPIPSCDAL
jgi:hypothetical protein